MKFFKSLLDSGLILEEAEFLDNAKQMPGLDYESVDFFHECRKVPFPPTVNRNRRIALERALSAKARK